MTIFTKNETEASIKDAYIKGNVCNVRLLQYQGPPSQTGAVLKSRKLFYEGNLFAASPRPEVDVHLTTQNQSGKIDHTRNLDRAVVFPV
jgi:hypothetical protein